MKQLIGTVVNYIAGPWRLANNLLAIYILWLTKTSYFLKGFLIMPNMININLIEQQYTIE